MSEYTTQLVGICTNKSIQNFLEAPSILCKYTPFVYYSCMKITEKLRWDLERSSGPNSYSKQGQSSKLLHYYYGAQGPGQSQSHDTDSSKSLSNLFQCLTTFTIRNLSSWYPFGVSFVATCLLHCILLLSISPKNLHFFYTTDPTSAKAARKLLLRPFFTISLHINSKVIHKKW